MGKKRHHNASYQKPAATLHPSLSSPITASSSTSEDAPSSVNQLLAKLRKNRPSNTDDPDNTIDLSALAITSTSRTVHPSLKSILHISDTPAPRPRSRITPDSSVARSTSRGSGLNVRGPAGPPPPRSWLLAGSIHAPAHVRTRNRIARQRRDQAASRPQSLEALPGMRLPCRGSLRHTTLSSLAHNWQWHLVYDQYHLATLPQNLKSILLYYIAMYESSSKGVTKEGLRVLFLASDEREGGTGGEAVTHLDLSNAIGPHLTLANLTAHLSIPHTQKPQPGSETACASSLPDSWDSVPEDYPTSALNTLSLSPAARYPALTHLSLARPTSPPSDSATLPLWPSLLRMLTGLFTLTHLSLAHWPAPSTTPNAQTTTLTSRFASINYSATDLYSHFEGDFYEAAAILRRLSKATYCLKWIDFSGCNAWWTALRWSVQGEGIEWNAGWRSIDTIVLKSGAKESIATPWTALMINDDSEMKQHLQSVKKAETIAARVVAKRVEEWVRAKRREVNGRYCQFVLDDEIAQDEQSAIF